MSLVFHSSQCTVHLKLQGRGMADPSLVVSSSTTVEDDQATVHYGDQQTKLQEMSAEEQLKWECEMTWEDLNKVSCLLYYCKILIISPLLSRL